MYRVNLFSIHGCSLLKMLPEQYMQSVCKCMSAIIVIQSYEFVNIDASEMMAAIVFSISTYSSPSRKRQALQFPDGAACSLFLFVYLEVCVLSSTFKQQDYPRLCLSLLYPHYNPPIRDNKNTEEGPYSDFFSCLICALMLSLLFVPSK